MSSALFSNLYVGFSFNRLLLVFVTARTKRFHKMFEIINLYILKDF